jgi:hypothetical protein
MEDYRVATMDCSFRLQCVRWNDRNRGMPGLAWMQANCHVRSLLNGLNEICAVTELSDLGAWLVKRTSVRLHSAIIETLIVFGGIALIVGALMNEPVT